MFSFHKLDEEFWKRKKLRLSKKGESIDSGELYVSVVPYPLVDLKYHDTKNPKKNKFQKKYGNN